MNKQIISEKDEYKHVYFVISESIAMIQRSPPEKVGKLSIIVWAVSAAGTACITHALNGSPSFELKLKIFLLCTCGCDVDFELSIAL